jgi:hypothetical protein
MSFQPLLASANDSEVLMVLFGGGIVVAVVAIITEAVRKIAQTKSREETRREIAAYVAEGTISPDDAAKLLAAGGSIKEQLANKLKDKLNA